MLQTKSSTRRQNRHAIAERASLKEVDRPSPYSAIFISVTRTTMTLETSENMIFVRFTLCYLIIMLTELNWPVRAYAC